MTQLPPLTVNHTFIQDFIAADAPCFALGMIADGQQSYGLLALRPQQAIPTQVTDLGLNFGHSLLGNDTFEVIHFAFEFYGYQTFNVLLNPNNPLVQSVLAHLIEHSNYFFLALDPTNHVTAFRGDIGQETLTGLRDNLTRIQHSTTTPDQYQRAVTHFADNPYPNGPLLQWVCRDNLASLDLTGDQIILTPR